MKTSAILGASVLMAAFTMLAGCSSSPTASGLGEIRVRLVDAPAAFQQVNIVVKSVEAHMSSSDSLHGWVAINGTRNTYDLLTLRNGSNAILGDTKLAVGKYTQLRLSIDTGSNVVIANVSYPLDVSSATGLKLNHNFDIAEGTLYSLTLDFNADKSIVLTGTNLYKLDPVIRVEADVVSGTISGTIAPAASRATVSTVSGSDTITTSADSTSGAFELMALPAGTYSVAIHPTDTLFADTTVAGVTVVAQQNTNLGTITLRAK